jgi:hypothetical protein
MLIVGSFFLLRPGEYAATENPDATPFGFVMCIYYYTHADSIH